MSSNLSLRRPYVWLLAASLLLAFTFGSAGAAQAGDSTVAVSAAARGGNGNGGGKPTKPEKPTKPPKPTKPDNGGGNQGGDLTFESKPSTWNTNWEHAEGTVQAFVRGKDADEIDLSSVELAVEGGEGGIAPRSVRYVGKQVVAHFSKAEAMELLGDDVDSGDRVTLVLRFTVGDEDKEMELTDQIRIVGPNTGGGGGDGEDDDVHAKVSPDDWNTNWQRSSGQVHVFLRGDGVKDIDLDSIRLVGDDAEAEPLKPQNVRRVGKQIVARFSKPAAFALLDDPDRGETHVVKVRYLAGEDDEEKELSEDIRIVGP